ncbi:MAG: transposase [Clostridiales bacterium]|nr:transposase [Clostridiales bacterium]
MNFATKAICAISSGSYINAASAVDLFNKLLSEYPGSILNIVLDNAKYQKCKAISEYIALHPSIKLFYLPPYSPNLNLIERFWKYAKSEMLNGAHADTFAEFKLRIDKFLYEADKANRRRVNSPSNGNL